MYWVAFFLGLAGSLHCVAMCGPLMLAMPLSSAAGRTVLYQTLVYQFGRIAMYAVLGLLFGLLGKGVVLAGLQQGLSIAAGASLLFAAFFAVHWERYARAVPGMLWLTHWVQGRIGQMLHSPSIGISFGIGMLNGLIPCGLVYAAVAGAISMASGWQGGAFMALFGLGTLPLLWLLMATGQRFSTEWRRRFRLVQPAMLVLAGLLLLTRGLQLDLSLFESAVPKAGADCH
ncbi:MAG: sulfite exporter TauE/SafE family protein [Saprospiraceae bacterium]